MYNDIICLRSAGSKEQSSGVLFSQAHQYANLMIVCETKKILEISTTQKRTGTELISLLESEDSLRLIENFLFPRQNL